jgi:hypothetical protein
MLLLWNNSSALVLHKILLVKIAGVISKSVIHGYTAIALTSLLLLVDFPALSRQTWTPLIRLRRWGQGGWFCYRVAHFVLFLLYIYRIENFQLLINCLIIIIIQLISNFSHESSTHYGDLRTWWMELTSFDLLS